MMKKKKPMSETRKRILSEQAKERWASLPEEERERQRTMARAAYEAKYPGRVELSQRTRAAIESGELVPGPCQDCGGDEAQPEYDYEALVLAGWSHYECRRQRKS